MARVEISNKYTCKESNLKDDTICLYHYPSQNFIIELSYSDLFIFLSKHQQKKMKKLKIDLDSEIIINLDLKTMNEVIKNRELTCLA